MATKQKVTTAEALNSAVISLQTGRLTEFIAQVAETNEIEFARKAIDLLLDSSLDTNRKKWVVGEIWLRIESEKDLEIVSYSVDAIAKRMPKWDSDGDDWRNFLRFMDRMTTLERSADFGILARMEIRHANLDVNKNARPRQIEFKIKE